MEVKLEIPEYSKEKGIVYKWELGFDIQTKFENNIFIIEANKDGLMSLANHLLNLAQEKVPQGHNLHFDEFNSLEGGSVELIIVKK